MRSSPSTKAGRSRVPRPGIASTRLGCDPRPAPRPGAALVLDDMPIRVKHVVAILAQHQGRAQLDAFSSTSSAFTALRSSPNTKAGRSLKFTPAIVDTTYGCDPRPAPRPGAAKVRGHLCPIGIVLRSSPSTKAGRSRSSRTRSSPGPMCCDPRPAPRPGAAPLVLVGQGGQLGVAILAQHQGRAQLLVSVRMSGIPINVAILAQHQGRAQPGRGDHRPRRRLGVAILAQHQGRAQLLVSVRMSGIPINVAILAQHQGRAQLGSASSFGRARELRSSPSTKAGRSRYHLIDVTHSPQVAILAQHQGRAQPGGKHAQRPPSTRCDPRPAPRPGAA